MKKTIACLLFGVMFTGTSFVGWNNAEAADRDEVKEELNELQQKKEKIDDKQGILKSEKKEIEQKIDENLSKQDSVASQIESINQKLSKTKAEIQTKEKQITSTNRKINQLKTKIEQLKTEIIKLKESIKEREAILKERLRAIQQNGGGMKYLEVIMGSQSFTDFISRSSAVATIMEQDKQIMDSLAADRKKVEKKKLEVENNKKEVEAKKEALESQKQELVSLKAQLDSQMAEKENLMAELEEEQQYLEEYKLSVAEKQELLNKQEQALQKAMRMAEKKLEQASQVQTQSANDAPQMTGGDFIWPTSGSKTSNFGWRVHPVTHTRSFHSGIDIGAPVGRPIYASASGVAMIGNLDNSYGNHVMIVSIIDGVKYTHLYAHMSQFAVSNGQAVEQGDLIGYVGMTGRSTGPHLHFELHKGGWIGYHPPNSNAVNPINYLN